MLYIDFQNMLVLTFTVASRYYNCCTDGGTNPGNYGYPLISLCTYSFQSFSTVQIVSAVFFRIQSQGSPYGICSAHSGIKAVYLPNTFDFFISAIIPLMHLGWYNGPACRPITEGFGLTPPQGNFQNNNNN
jgi:hypothetical protein